MLISSFSDYIRVVCHTRIYVHAYFVYVLQRLLELYSKDLQEVKLIFDDQIALSQTPSGPLLNKNMPRVAGSLKWSQQLKERVKGGMEKLRAVGKK